MSYSSKKRMRFSRDTNNKCCAEDETLENTNSDNNIIITITITIGIARTKTITTINCNNIN